MNWDALKPFLVLIFTSLLKIAGGALAGHGIINGTPAGMEAFMGYGLAAGGAVWSWWVQSGHVAAANYLKKLTDTATQAAAIEVAKRMPQAAVTGAAAPAKAAVAASNPSLMAADAAKAASVLFAIFAIGLMFSQGAVAQPRAKAAAATAAPVATIPAAPAATPVNGLQAFLNEISKKAAAINAFTIADAQAAMTMAASDPVGLSCYTAIYNKLSASGPGSLIPQSPGLLQLIEAARLAKLQVGAVQSGTDPIVMGCAPLILDANNTLLMLAGQGAIGAATTAIGLPILPGL